MFIDIADCPEKPQSSEDLDLESRIGKEVHKRKESEVRCKSESTTGTSREDSADDSSESADSSLVVDVVLVSEEHATIENSYDE